MIDWKRMAALRHEVGEDEFAPLVELFLDEIEGAIMTMVPNDPDRMEQRLHFLKGCGLNMGLNAFCRLCDTWERMVATGLGDQLDVEALMAGCWLSSASMPHSLILVWPMWKVSPSETQRTLPSIRDAGELAVDRASDGEEPGSAMTRTHTSASTAMMVRKFDMPILL